MSTYDCIKQTYHCFELMPLLTKMIDRHETCISLMDAISGDFKL